MSTVSELAHIAPRYWSDFYTNGARAMVAVGGVSSLAATLLWVWYPGALEFLFVAVLSTGLHFGAMYSRDVRRGEYNPEHAPSYDFVEGAAVLGALVCYFTAVMAVTAIAATELRTLTQYWVVPLFVAMYYPVADFKLVVERKSSPGVVPVTLLFWILQTKGVLDEKSSVADVFEEFLHRPPKVVRVR